MLDNATIIVAGTGGQGVKSLANILGNLLIQLDYDVTVLVNYDSASRGGTIYAYIVFDKNKVINPIIDKADFLLDLANNTRKFSFKQRIAQEGVKPDQPANFYNFFGMGREKYKKEIYGNSVALGTLLAYLEADLDKLDIRAAMPKKLPDDNVEAVKDGFNLKN
ncbi:2-oxoacid:acceptor oxidoreductase family protein [Patescibacteria group bacterium]